MVKRLFLSMALLLCSVAVIAAQNPVVMLQQVSSRLLTQLVRQKATIKNNQAVLHSIVGRIIVPYFDLNVMSRSVVGRNYWKNATVSQRNEFKKEFTRFVTRTYSIALSDYNDERVLFYPIRGGVGNKKRVQVYSKIERRSNPSISMNYRLYRTSNTWQIYDFSVEGISIVQSYRSQFANVLSQKGMQGLIADLKSHNQGVQ